MAEPRATISLIHLLPSDGVGGVEIAARSLIDRTDLACDARLMLIAGPAISANARVIASPYRSSLNPFAHLRALRILLAQQPDVVLFSLWRTAVVAVVLRLLRPASRLVFVIHSDRTLHVLDRLGSYLGMRAAHESWFDSASSLRARATPLAKSPRVISFVTSRPPAPPAASPPSPRFVLWARISHQKGIDRAIAIVAALVERGVEASFDIWGPDAGVLAPMQHLTTARGLDARIRFRGPIERSRLPEIAAEASFFLQPSRAEGMSLSCVEAMQLGLVPLVTAVGEMARYVKDDANGLILGGTDPAEDARRIPALITDPDRYARLRAAAIETWTNAPLYADDVCRAASELAKRG